MRTAGPMCSARNADPGIFIDTAEKSRETAEPVATLNTRDKGRHLNVQQPLKDDKDRAQLSLLAGEELI